jgi:hypothetical protein
MILYTVNFYLSMVVFDLRSLLYAHSLSYELASLVLRLTRSHISWPLSVMITLFALPSPLPRVNGQMSEANPIREGACWMGLAGWGRAG